MVTLYVIDILVFQFGSCFKCYYRKGPDLGKGGMKIKESKVKMNDEA